MKKEIVLWFGDYPDQRALATKLSQKYSISGIVFERRKNTSIRKIGLKTLIGKVLSKLFLRRLDNSWKNLMNFYDSNYPNYPEVPTLFVENINSQEVIDFYLDKKSPLVLISGTRLVKEDLLKLNPEIGIINLHTGLSPYVKGGPNCTNWCLSNNTLHLIGNTIMWVDLGIDSGNLISTKRVEFSGSENLNEIHIKVMEEAHELYMSAVETLLNDSKSAPNIPQNEIANGTTFYNKMWGFKEKRKVLVNMRKFSKNITKCNAEKNIDEIILVDCPSIKK